MRVLWFSCTPSLYVGDTYGGGWVASLELAFRKYVNGIELGIAFEYNNDTFKEEKDSVTYYPIKKFTNRFDKLKWQINPDKNWDYLRNKSLEVIKDFKPDIIQCFGSEWDWGLLSKEIDIPIVIHMQGFKNIYYISGRFAIKPIDYFKYYHYNPFQLFRYSYRNWKDKRNLAKERKIMLSNRYFLGRTKWDKDIVNHFSPNAVYFHCDEIIRPEIYESHKKWHYSNNGKIRLVTISGASVLKGNGLILETANILKTFNVDFEWQIAGDPNSFKLFEKITGLDHRSLNIKLLGRINAHQIVDVLCGSDFFVQTSIIDNSPNALCEAQLIGIPIITSYVGGIPSLVEDNQTGFFYPYNEPYALAFKIMDLYGKKELLKDVSNRAQEISYTRHNPQEISKCLCDIYHQIIKKHLL